MALWLFLVFTQMKRSCNDSSDPRFGSVITVLQWEGEKKPKVPTLLLSQGYYQTFTRDVITTSDQKQPNNKNNV